METAVNKLPISSDVLVHLPGEYTPAAIAETISGRESTAAFAHVTMVVCTYNRAHSVARLLDSCKTLAHRPMQLLIVDASTNDTVEQLIRQRQDYADIAGDFAYFRVSGALRGLTRQRNFALQYVTSDLVAFFDDDVVFTSDCLYEMEQVHRAYGDKVIGTGAVAENAMVSPTLLWRVRHWLRMVPDLQPGRYHASGMSVPWSFLVPSEATVEGDWLPGYAMMWKTAVAREVGFCGNFAGYAQGEDLDFSLRIRNRGKLLMVCSARLLHLHDQSGRPNYFKLGYMAIYNRYHIHRRGLPARNWRDIAWFVYAWSIDTLMILRSLPIPGRSQAVLYTIAGRAQGIVTLLKESLTQNSRSSTSDHDSTAMIGQATAHARAGLRCQVQRVWGLPDIHSRQKWSVLWPYLSRLPEQGIRLLDAGCGSGQWTLELAARRPGWQVVGIDMDGEAVQIAESDRQSLGLENAAFVQADFLTFHTTQPFNMVLSVASAHYLAETGEGQALFRQFQSWIKDDGSLLLLVPRRAEEMPLRAWIPLSKLHDVFSCDELVHYCAASGMHIETLQPAIGKAGALAKVIAMIGEHSQARRLLSLALYPLQIALSKLDTMREPGVHTSSVMWLLLARANSQLTRNTLSFPE
jgi:GT2 family glycosyltransferase/SAM-dependent methyltransferase